MRSSPANSRGRRAIRALALALALASAPASAQQAGNQQATGEATEPAPERPAPATDAQAFGDVEVLVIKGRHHENLLQETAVSATSFDTKELDDLRIQKISDLAEYTPNLDINTRSAASNPTLFIRGIGLKDYNANAAGAVAVYQDGININAPAIQLFQLFDVGSVEVLRGPQGAGSGRNASAGAIKVNSVQPDGAFGGNASFTYGNYNTIQAEGALNFPLIEEMLSARFAFTANFRDGTTKNQCAGWNPEAFGFNTVTENTIRTTWDTELNPSASRVNNILYGAGAFNGVGPRGPRYIYDPTFLDADGNLIPNDGTRDDEIRDRLIENDIGVGRFPTVGGVKGRLVGIQDDIFRPPTDGVCVLSAPGFIATPRGGDPLVELGPQLRPRDPPGPAYPADEIGVFQGLNVPTLESLQGLKNRVNDIDDWAGRGILRFQPREDMDWSLNAHGGRNRSDSRHLQMVGAAVVTQGNRETCVFCEATNFAAQFSERDAAILTGLEGLTEVDGLLVPDGVNGVPGGQTGDDPFSGWYDADGTEYLDAWGIGLRGNWDLGNLVVNSVGGTEWYDRFIEDEGDASPGRVFPAEWQDSARQWSEELRADYDGERFHVYVGGLFLKEKLSSNNIFPSTQNFRIEQEFEQKLWHVGPYVGGRYELTDEWSVESGIRYNFEHKEFSLSSSAVGNESDATVPQIAEQEESDTWTGVTGEFILGYTPYWSILDQLPNDHLNLYAKYGRAMKPGHFNAGLTIQTSGEVQQSITPVEPEFIHAVELGFKSGWLDNRLILNVTGFRYWYEDLQVFDIVNEIGALPTQQLLNTDARVWGAEVELQARPLPGLSINGGFGWLSGHFIDFTVQKAVGQPRGQGTLTTFDYDGNPLISAPKYSFSVIVDYEIPLGSVGSLIPGYDVSWRSKVYLDPQKLDPISQPAYWLHNARLTYRTPDGRIEVTGWVENFMNEYYKDDVFDLTRQYREILEVWGDPRTYGVTVTYTW